jgi:uncharacterized membrane-anchored protein YjiN (DUF445 family)
VRTQWRRGRISATIQTDMTDQKAPPPFDPSRRAPPRLPPLGKPAPPPAAAMPPMRAPLPSNEGFMSTNQKMSLVDAALQLRDEQLAAHVVHYKAELATSPELDMITAQVIAELKELQMVQRGSPYSSPPAAMLSPADSAQLEIELIESLKTMLSRLFRKDKVASVVERKLSESSKRFARLFFKSELHEKLHSSDNETKTMRYPAQALYHVFARNEEALLKELDGYEYIQPSVKEDAQATLSNWIKELRNDFLGRSTPELNSLVKLLNETMTKFFTAELPPVISELSWEVVKEARLGDAKIRAGYKISADAFPRFRQSFERRFLQRLVTFAEEEMLRRVRESPAGKFRVETIHFVADPHIFSDICELICDAVYDYLYNDGFLDLPQDWRNRLAAPA